MNTKLVCSVLAALLVGTGFSAGLVVEKDHPQSLAEGAYSYDTIVLHDNLTLAPKAIITMTDSGTHADTIFLGAGAGELPVLTIVGQSQVKCTSGKAGCLCIGGSGEAGSGGFGRVIVDGGPVSTPSPQLRLFYLKVTEGATVPSDDNTILRLGKSTQNGQLLVAMHGVQNFNEKPVKVQFAGGYLSSSEGASDYWFSGAVGSTIVLESVDGEPIRFLNGGHTSRDFKDGNVHLKFVGAGDFSPYPASSISSERTAANYSIILGGTSADYDWSEFSGDINVEKGVLVVQGQNILPCAVSCGILTSMDGDARFDIRADQAINGIDTEGVITNGTSKGASAVVLTVGSAKDGIVRVGEVNRLFTFRQTGHTVTLDTAFVPNYDLVVGTLLVTNNVVVSNLTLAAGTTVRVDGGVLAFSGDFTDNGATIACVNGGSFGRLCAAESDATSGAFVDEPASSGLVKTGAGTFMVNQRKVFAAKALDVREGVLKLSGAGSTNEWWRVTVNASGYRMNLAAIGLFADDTLNSVLDGYSYSQATDVAGLARGRIYYDTEKYVVDSTGVRTGVAENDPVTFSSDAAVLLDSDPKTGMTLKLNGGSNPNGIAFTFRRAEGDVVPVTAYSLRYPINGSQPTHNYAARSPSEYVIETSADGADWLTVGKVGSRGDGTWGSWTDNRSFPLDLPAGGDVPGAKGLAAGVSVRVAEGATLDCSNVADGVELSALTVDVALGGGTLRNVRLAATGTLDLVHLPTNVKLGGYEIPLTFEPSVTTGDLSGWTLRVNGAEVDRTLAWKDGKLTVVPNGVVIILR